MKKQTNTTMDTTPKRRLSLFRVLIGLLVVGSIGYLILHNWQRYQGDKNIGNLKPWFASYVDVTATPRFDFEQLGSTSAHNLVLSFIVSSSDDACTPTWGNAYTLESARIGLDLDRRIARLRQQGGEIAISFGGLLNKELAVSCTDSELLIKAYKSVVEKYDVDIIDLDLEGEGLTNTTAVIRRAVAIASLQEQRRVEGKNLAVWLTLPVTPQGLSVDGTNAIAKMLENKVDISGVNVMTMDYGQSKPKSQGMYDASKLALLETHRQLGILYTQAGITLNSASLWKKIGATPMIGQNDFTDEVFTLEDANAFHDYALSMGVVRMSMWSANRDIQCGDNYVNTSIVSDSCSGIKQEKLDFARTLSEGFNGELYQNASVVTTQDPKTETDEVDDPKNSPYQIWKEDGTYLEGTKVVWHKNVYQAKWWTQGNLPDNPVLQAWQTPWQLVGPVLPGEKPVQQPNLPKGTYPKWSGSVAYESGERVLFNGIPYQAKWWTQGDSPAASTSNPTSSPWVALTQAQIEKVLKELQTEGN